MEKRNVLKLFLASSSDVQSERESVKQVVAAWNRSIGDGRGWQVDVFDYNTHAAPDYGTDAQTVVNRRAGSMSRFTFFIGILKHRFGTPTPRYPSGTNEEFNRAVTAYKKTQRLSIKLYFSTASLPHGADLQHKQKVEAFRKKVEPLGLLGTYRTVPEFRQQFSEHFHLWMEGQMKLAPKTARPRRVPTPRRAAPTTAKPAPKPSAPTSPKPKTPPKPKVTKTKATKPKTTKTASAPATVSTAGQWLLLDGHLFRHRAVKGQGNQLTLPLLSSTGEEESLLRRLCQSQSYNVHSYAHGRDGGQVRLNSCEHESQGSSTLWTFQASLERSSRGWMTPEEAEQRARLLLLGRSAEPNAPNSQIANWSHRGASIYRSPDAPPLFAALWAEMAGKRGDFLHAAFLHAVQRLKFDGLCEDILELKLGPIKNNLLRVQFRGRMASSFSGSGQVIEIKGDCSLSQAKPSPR